VEGAVLHQHAAALVGDFSTAGPHSDAAAANKTNARVGLQ